MLVAKLVQRNNCTVFTKYVFIANTGYWIKQYKLSITSVTQLVVVLLPYLIYSIQEYLSFKHWVYCVNGQYANEYYKILKDSSIISSSKERCEEHEICTWRRDGNGDLRIFNPIVTREIWDSFSDSKIQNLKNMGAPSLFIGQKSLCLLSFMYHLW